MTRGVRWLAPVLGWALTTAALARAVIAAPPQVEIGAQTKLVVDRVRVSGDDLVEIRGTLLDNLTGDGIPSQLVTIQIGDARTTALTDNDGHFRAHLAVEPGSLQVDLSFRGTKLLVSSRLTQQSDPARQQVALT